MFHWQIGLHTPTGFGPMLKLSRYEVRDWWDWVTPPQLGLLRILGRYQDGDGWAEQRLAELRQLISSAGVQFVGRGSRPAR